MNRIRKMFAAEVAALAPLLHQTYRCVGTFQKNRSDRNATRLATQLDEVAPHLEFFRPYVPGPKQGYFAALASPDLELSDRIVALDVAVGSLHIDFPVERAYMHRESAQLRRVLEQSRHAPEDDRVPQEAVWVGGIGASPGVITAPAFVAAGASGAAEAPPDSVLVTIAPRPEILASLPNLAGLVAERGGMLSHAAIVAREMGIPCVVGARRATQRIRSGQLVTVDGGAGTVEPGDA